MTSQACQTDYWRRELQHKTFLANPFVSKDRGGNFFRSSVPKSFLSEYLQPALATQGGWSWGGHGCQWASHFLRNVCSSTLPATGQWDLVAFPTRIREWQHFLAEVRLLLEGVPSLLPHGFLSASWAASSLPPEARLAPAPPTPPNLWRESIGRVFFYISWLFWFLYLLKLIYKGGKKKQIVKKTKNLTQIHNKKPLKQNHPYLPHHFHTLQTEHGNPSPNSKGFLPQHQALGGPEGTFWPGKGQTEPHKGQRGS